jgi:hypothetical protein
MSPRNFDKINKTPLPKETLDQLKPGMNLWYAFTAVTGIDKIFSYTPDEINTNPVKDSQSGTDQSDINYYF